MTEYEYSVCISVLEYENRLTIVGSKIVKNTVFEKLPLLVRNDSLHRGTLRQYHESFIVHELSINNRLITM